VSMQERGKQPTEAQVSARHSSHCLVDSVRRADEWIARLLRAEARRLCGVCSGVMQQG
jgi:hypothetical protein